MTPYTEMEVSVLSGLNQFLGTSEADRKQILVDGRVSWKKTPVCHVCDLPVEKWWSKGVTVRVPDIRSVLTSPQYRDLLMVMQQRVTTWNSTTFDYFDPNQKIPVAGIVVSGNMGLASHEVTVNIFSLDVSVKVDGDYLEIA